VNSTTLRDQELAEARALKAERDAARKRAAFAMFEAGCSTAEAAREVRAGDKTVARWRKEWST
jgi:hypothetical protein